MFKAVHRETRNVVAIKMIPVENDLQSLRMEISILKTCKSPYIVKYLGSYLKDNNIWVRDRPQTAH